MSGLVYRRLVEPVRDSVPPGLSAALESRYAATVRDNLRNADALDRIDAAFDVRGIRALLVKGMALVRGTYRDPGIRQMSDVDLVIWPDHHENAVSILIDQGYVRDRVHPTVFTNRQVTLDVKREPFGSTRIRARKDVFGGGLSLWDATQGIDGYRCLSTWSAPVTLYTQVVHALKHGFPDGVWLTDLGEIWARMSPSDLNRSARLFVGTGNQNALALAMLRLEAWGYGHLMAAPGLSPRPYCAGTTRVLAGMPRRRLAHLVEAAYLLARPGPTRWSSLREAFFPNRAVYREDLPAALRPLKHLIRVVDVVLSTGKSVTSRKQGV